MNTPLFSRWAGKLLASPSRPSRHPTTLLRMEPLEGRDVPSAGPGDDGGGEDSGEDPPSPPVVSVAAIADAVEGGTDGTFRFSRTGATTASLVVAYSVRTTGTNVATPGDDYGALSGTVTIAAGSSYADVPVDAANDSLAEASETVTVDLSTSSSYTLGAATAVVTVLDRPVVSVVWVADAVEGGASGVFQVTRTGDTGADLTVTYTVQSVGPGLATPGDDYTTLSGSVTIPAGYASADLYVVAADDQTLEIDEKVVVVLQSAEDYELGDAHSADVTIRDAQSGVIAGRVWADDDEDGVQDDEGGEGDEEYSVAGTIVTLLQDGVEIGSTTADEGGAYAFTGVEPGAGYTVEFTAPAGDPASITAMDVGTDDGKDSDADPVTGQTAPIVVAAGAAALRDVGLIQQRGPSLRIDVPTGLNAYRVEVRITVDGGGTSRIGPVQIAANGPEDARAVLLSLMQEQGWVTQSAGTTGIYVTHLPGTPGQLPRPITAATVIVDGPVGRPTTRPTRGVAITNIVSANGSQFSVAPPAGTTQSAWVSFPPGGATNYAVKLTLTTAGNAASNSGWLIVVGQTADAARDSVSDNLPAAWTFMNDGSASIKIQGQVTELLLEYVPLNPMGQPVPNNGPDPQRLPILTGVGDVRVTRRRAR